MTDSILGFVTKNLESAKGYWPQIAKGSGVPYRTVQKIGSGKTRSPRIDTIEQLASYFRGDSPAHPHSNQKA